MFLKNCWYVACWEHEVPAAAPIGRQIIDEPIVLFRGTRGEIHALANRCAHRRAPLSLGSIEGDTIRCRYHGLLFGTNGRCLQVPGTDTIPRNSDIRTYPVLLRDSWVWIWMGEPAKADSSLVPGAFGLNDPKWVMRSSQIDYAANYMLINDNLCDLSHVDFVHERTLGFATGGGWSTHLPRVTRRERGLRVERWLLARPSSPSNPALVDTWSTYDYDVPGIFVMENRSYPHGMAEQVGFGAPSAEPKTYRIEQQAVTPTSQSETRYFFATGFDARLPPRLLEGIFETIMAAFAEDKSIIEAQQEMWDLTPPEQPMAFIVHDKAPSMFRRIIAKLIAAENATGLATAPVVASTRGEDASRDGE